MNITVSLSSWMVPTAITVIAIVVSIISQVTETKGGYFDGWWSGLVTIVCILVVAITWITYLLTMFFK